MKILSAEQIREADAYTIAHEPVASIELMERASRVFSDWFVECFDPSSRVTIVAGTGNNGGDGMAIGRMLIEHGFEVKACVLGSGEGSEDFQINYERLSRELEIPRINEPHDIDSLLDCDVVVDAIFGSGLARPVEGLHGEVIQKVNHTNAVKVAVDISSGLFSDQESSGKYIVEANYTFTFQIPKLAFLIPENDRYVGHWEVGDIGLDDTFLARQVTNNIYVTAEFLQPFIPRRPRHSHKGVFGKGMLVTGSHGKMGASVLASRAFMRSGAGLLTTLIPEAGYSVLQTAVPEAMVLTSGVNTLEPGTFSMEEFDAIGLGPGIGTDASTVELVEMILRTANKPLVIDADGLNILAQHRHLLSLVPSHSILTPHPKEFERLAGSSANGFARLQRLRKFSEEHVCYVVLKGAHTAIASPDGHVHFNSTGNPGMATGGSGDVLTGVITSLLAQHESPFHAAVLGVYIHGLAGDLAVEVQGEDGLIAGDIIESLPQAFLSFH